jgi:hypothetical protein
MEQAEQIKEQEEILVVEEVDGPLAVEVQVVFILEVRLLQQVLEEVVEGVQTTIQMVVVEEALEEMEKMQIIQEVAIISEVQEAE